MNEILEYYVANNDTLSADAVHDTDPAATTPELLAEPQNVIRGAYDQLRQDRYPLTLPFDLWIETVRRFCEHLGAPLWQVLETFRPADELFPPATNAKPYYRSAIFAEQLEVGPAERAFLIDSSPLDKWYELYGYPDATTAASELTSAKALARALGVSYKELARCVQTGFVNPQLQPLVILRKLGVDVADVFRFETGKLTPDETAAFQKRLEDYTTRFPKFKAKDWLDGAFTARSFDKVLTLSYPETGCDFGATTFQKANGDAAVPFDFLRLNLFVRTWRKLGWSIEETDQALAAFLPANSLPLGAGSIGDALKTALVYLANLRMVESAAGFGREGRTKLLTLWSDLSTLGTSPLYDDLFLTPAALKNDSAFDDPLGAYLSQSNVFIRDHLVALQSALNLTPQEIDSVLKDAGADVATSVLTLDNVSVLFRYALLARAMKFPVRDILALKALSGLDPGKKIDGDPLTTLDKDYPFTQTLRFIDVVEKVNASGFSVEDLQYLLRHSFDMVGKYAANIQDTLALVKSLSAEISRIKSETAAPADPLAFTDEMIRQKLALILPADVAETFFGMWMGTVEYQASTALASTDKIDPVVFAAEPAIALSYDEAHGQQRLTFRGVLVDARKAQLEDAFKNSTPAPPDAAKTAFASLLDAVQNQAHTFFDDHLKKSNGFGFLEATDFDPLFAPIGAASTDKEKQEAIRNKRAKLANAFLPFLQQKLMRQAIVQALAAKLNADAALVEALLTDVSIITDPSIPGTPVPVLDAFAAADERGMSVSFFTSADGSGTPLNAAPIEVPSADTAAAGPAKPAGAQSARFEGYLEASAAGPYRFSAASSTPDHEMEVHLGEAPDPLFRGKAPDQASTASVDLKAGVPYALSVDARKLGSGDLALLVQGVNLPAGPLSRLTLYPAAVVERVRRAYVLVGKALQLIRGLDLTQREVEYFAGHGSDFDNFNLSQLPTTPVDDALGLFAQFVRLADYTRLKREAAGSTDDMIGVFENARRTFPQSTAAADAEKSVFDDVCGRFGEITRRQPDVVRAIAVQLGFAAKSAIQGDVLKVEVADLTQEKGTLRLWEALRLLDRLGVPVASAAQATGIVADGSSADDRSAIARNFRNAVKARYEKDNWLGIAQPIFDGLRRRQRDALAAHVMHDKKFASIEELFEFFLIDPGMEPVVQTSRLRLAISSVQTFVQRCLLNLEPRVAPAAINADQWSWMKRYRVWEANRKIFLFPENWLDPEFRDDKTYLYQDLESALLQGDVSAELVEEALFDYLKKLQAIARLDVIAMYADLKGDPGLNVFYVLARTYAAPHKYFTRRLANKMWTPWEAVSVDIEGDHVIPVVWKNRLHVFWLTFIEKPSPLKGDEGDVTKTLSQYTFHDAVDASNKLAKDVEAHLNWAEYFQGKWTTRESGLGSPAQLGQVDRTQVFLSVFKEIDDGAIWIELTYPVEKITYFRVANKNSPPDPKPDLMQLQPPLVKNLPYKAERWATRFTIESGPLVSNTDGTDQTILNKADKKGDRFSLATCNNLLYDDFIPQGRASSLPFFYQDNQNTFYVEPKGGLQSFAKREAWVLPAARPDPALSSEDWWKELPIQAAVPSRPTLPDDDGFSRFTVEHRTDWITDPGVVLQLDGVLLGVGGPLVRQQPSMLVPGGSAAVAVIWPALPIRGAGSANSSPAAAPVTVIGGAGLNSALLANLRARRGAALAAAENGDSRDKR